MMRTILTLPDGTVISSGHGSGRAIQSCVYTQCVNSGQELTLGSVCAAMVELKIWAPGGLEIVQGDRLLVYKTTDDAHHLLGVFFAETLERSSPNVLRLTAYDSVTKLDTDVSDWLQTVSFPCTLQALAKGVCGACGVSLGGDKLPNGSYLVEKFTARGVTGRQVMGWIGQAAGRFCRAMAHGDLEFAWYTPLTDHIADPVGQAPDRGSLEYADGILQLRDTAMSMDYGEGILTLQTQNLAVSAQDGTAELTLMGSTTGYFCYQGGLLLGEYAVAPIANVCIRADESDVGIQHPGAGGNTYYITGNPLLTGSREALEAVAKTLHAQLSQVTYTPGAVTIPATCHIEAGHILPVRDREGVIHDLYIMERRQSGQRDTFKATGSPSRDSATAAEQTVASLAGKLFHLRTDLDGLRAENKDASGRLSSLSLDVDGIRTQVAGHKDVLDGLQEAVTQVSQTAGSLRIDIQTLKTQGAAKVKTAASYTFDDQGLQITKEGQQMKNLLDSTGMYVTRGGGSLLRANADGVAAADVTVHNYLIIGDHARLEDYPDGRTACFYIGG